MNVLYFYRNPVTNNFWQKFYSNWYDRVSQRHDMMINTFQSQKQMWALHFQNKHNLGQTHLNFWGQRCLYIKSFLLKTSRMFLKWKYNQTLWSSKRFLKSKNRSLLTSNDLTLFLLPILDEFIIQNNIRKVYLASSQTKLDIKINSTKPDKA